MMGRQRGGPPDKARARDAIAAGQAAIVPIVSATRRGAQAAEAGALAVARNMFCGHRRRVAFFGNEPSRACMHSDRALLSSSLTRLFVTTRTSKMRSIDGWIAMAISIPQF
jgi:hypothetical protein